jgi:hypothetical protein
VDLCLKVSEVKVCPNRGEYRRKIRLPARSQMIKNVE